jgi:hypothetical protein
LFSIFGWVHNGLFNNKLYILFFLATNNIFYYNE